jgi:hypothetical protein
MIGRRKRCAHRFAGALGVVAIAATLCGGRAECAVGGQRADFQIDVPRVISPIAPGAVVSANDGEIEEKAGRTIPAPAAWDEGFPIPASARRNDSLGGATSVAPGKNYTVRVYDTDAVINAMSAFYAHHLPDAKRVSVGREVRFSTLRGTVRLLALEKGTRITLVIGPR